MHLVVGSNSCFGRATVAALQEAGESVRTLEAPAEGWLEIDTVVAAAEGCVSITAAVERPMNAWYPDLVRFADAVCAAAEITGATVLVPSGMYGFKVIYDVPLPPEPPPADANDRPCEPGRVRDQIEATYAQLADLSGNRVIVVRAGDTFGPGSLAWPAAEMVRAAAAGRRVPWPGHPSVGHAFTFVPDLARLGVRALLGAPLPKPMLTAEEQEDPDRLPPSPLEVYALHGHLLADAAAWASALGAPGALRVPHTWIRARALWDAAYAKLPEVLYTWEGSIFLDDRRTRRWMPDFTETPLADAIRETLSAAKA